MSDDVNAEQRDGVRLRKLIDVIVEDPASSTLVRAAIADISETGMRVVIDQYLPKGATYTFTLKRAPFSCLRGEVRWTRSLEGDAFAAGIRFVHLDDTQRRTLRTFVETEKRRRLTIG